MTKTVLEEIFVIMTLIRKNKEGKKKKINVLIFELKRLDSYDKNKLEDCVVKELIKIKVEINYTEIKK